VQKSSTWHVVAQLCHAIRLQRHVECSNGTEKPIQTIPAFTSISIVSSSVQILLASSVQPSSCCSASLRSLTSHTLARVLRPHFDTAHQTYLVQRPTRLQTSPTHRGCVCSSRRHDSSVGRLRKFVCQLVLRMKLLSSLMLTLTSVLVEWLLLLSLLTSTMQQQLFDRVLVLESQPIARTTTDCRRCASKSSVTFKQQFHTGV
jgi:hypothetical protein